jgi:hypothetical protein
VTWSSQWTSKRLRSVLFPLVSTFDAFAGQMGASSAYLCGSQLGCSWWGRYVMQFLWNDYRPDLMEKEYEYHSGLYYTGGLNYEYETNHIQARGDIYLIIVGSFFLLESVDIVQRIFANKFFVFLGKRSLRKLYSFSG